MSQQAGARPSGRVFKTIRNNNQMKAKLRQNCLDRIRSRRSEIVSRSRLQNSSNYEHQLLLNAKELVSAFAEEEGLSESDLFSLMEEMEEELRREEELLLQEIQLIEAEKAAEAEHAYHFERNEDSGNHSDCLICPICQSHSLVQTKANIILCSGGFCLRLDTVGDGVSLDNLRSMLNNVYSEHGSQCSGSLSFALVDRFGIQTLQASCQICRCNHIVV